MSTAEFSTPPAVNPFDKWAQPENAGRQQAVMVQMEQHNPRFLAVVEQWADLLVAGEMPPYAERPTPIYADIDVKSPNHFTYENPFPDRRGRREYSQDELERPNPPIHMALDAAVKRRRPDAFVAGAASGVFDPYDPVVEDRHVRTEYFVLGDVHNATQHPSETADRALVVRTGHIVSAELAPRYSAEGAAARAAAKAAIAESEAAYARAEEAARALGGSAMSLLVQRAAERLAAGLADAYGLTGSDRAEDEARHVLSKVWVPRPDNPNSRTTPITISELLANANAVDMADLARAFARLYPNDTPQELTVRMLG